jgi:UDP-N-acetylmuramoylalanine--D-glutamate ligase
MDQKSKIAILGYGVEGKAVLKYLLKHGYNEVTVCDANVGLKEKFSGGVSVRLGTDYLNDLDEFEVLFRSPGVKYLEPEIQMAVKNGAEVTSCTGFFLEQCICPAIGVSGTKGKGTCATLIYEILKKGRKDAHLGGNIGKPPMEFIEKLKGDDVVVLEMSSFQLQDLRLSPKYAVLLNTTEDHLDYHADVGEYLRAKESLLAHQDEEGVVVLNKDYKYVKQYEGLVRGRALMVSVKGEVKDGAFVKDGVVYWSKNGKREKVMDVDDIALIGSHNLENVLPAVVMGREFGVSVKNIASVLRKFEGLPHRLELVREVKGVRFYNDSFSTNGSTSMAAVDSFEEPTVLIAGGSDKGLDYGDWASAILRKPNLKTVILIGETADKMEKEIVEAEEKLGEAEGSVTKVLRRADLEEAVISAFAEASNGSVVVMSPAAASFDMFKDYKERGKKFGEYVGRLG